MFCPKCKEEIPENSKYCINCGFEFKEKKSPIEKNPCGTLDELKTTIPIDTIVQSFQPGSLFAKRYEILSEAKRGGMGAVYKVKDVTLNKVKALKIIHPNLASEGDATLRFKQEVALSQDLVHPNIVRVYDYGDSEGIQYFTMEWIDGITLREIINKRKRENKPFSLEEACKIILPLSNALEHAHQHTIHRDIKPENILVTREIDTGELTVKLTDFGIAKMLTPAQLTSTSSQMGTPYYMAPEQKVDAAHADKRADIYGLGVVLLELLTLENSVGLELPSEINKELPKEIDSIIKKAIATRPEDRYKDVKELSEALKAILVKVKGKVEVKEERTEKVTEKKEIREQAKKPESVSVGKREKPIVKWTAFIVLLLAVIGFIYFYTVKKEPPKSPEKPLSNIEAKLETPQHLPKSEPEERPKSEVKEQKDPTKEKKDKGDTISPKKEAKQEEVAKVEKVLPDDEKRSAIVEVNGYAEVLQGKNIKELREEALEDARSQAFKLAQTHMRGLSRGVSVVFADASDKTSGRTRVNILEQKDFGIKEGKHYHVWIKAEVQYKIEKSSQTALLNPQGPLTVSVWTDKKEYREGEQMRIYLQGNKPFYARIIYVDVSGKIVQLLPNAYRTQNSFESGKIYMIPDQGDRFKLEIEPPFGLEKVMVFASPNPLGDVSMDQLDKGLYGYRGDIKTLGTKSRGIKIAPTEPSKQDQLVSRAAEFYEALWQVETHR